MRHRVAPHCDGHVDHYRVNRPFVMGNVGLFRCRKAKSLFVPMEVALGFSRWRTHQELSQRQHDHLGADGAFLKHLKRRDFGSVGQDVLRMNWQSENGQ